MVRPFEESSSIEGLGKYNRKVVTGVKHHCVHDLRHSPWFNLRRLSFEAERKAAPGEGCPQVRHQISSQYASARRAHEP